MSAPVPIAAASELAEALNDTMLALAMCHPRTPHGAQCQQAAILRARAALANFPPYSTKGDSE